MIKFCLSMAILFHLFPPTFSCGNMNFFVIFYRFLGEISIFFLKLWVNKVPSYLLVEGRLSVFLYSSLNTQKKIIKSILRGSKRLKVENHKACLCHHSLRLTETQSKVV